MTGTRRADAAHPVLTSMPIGSIAGADEIAVNLDDHRVREPTRHYRAEFRAGLTRFAGWEAPPLDAVVPTARSKSAIQCAAAIPEDDRPLG